MASSYGAAMRVLLTGMSGTGKSTLVRELRRRGHAAYDADDDGFSEPREDGRWGWRAELVADLAVVEPLLRRSADLILDSTTPPARLADLLLARIAELDPRHARARDA
jgi:broad-specificity NMP kinase